jgi:membrane protein
LNKIQFLNLFMNTYSKWQKHDATLRAAALTFFTIMPLPSLALIAVEILALAYGQEAALEQLINQISTLAGPSVADLISQLLINAQSPLTSVFGSLLSIIFAISGAIGAFSVLQKSMDVIWEIRQPRGIVTALKEKVLPFLLIIALGLIVVTWTSFSTVLFGITVDALEPILGGFTGFLLRILEILLSFGLGTLLFALIFKLLPETKVEWRDVTLAAVVTAIVFTVLNYLFGVYLSLFQVTTLAGTAGSLMVLFLWVYLTSLFILFGAQLSKVYSQTYGSHKDKPVTPKTPQVEEVDRVEMDAELNIRRIP